MLDGSLSVDEHAELPADLRGKLREGPGKLRGDDSVGRNASPIEVQEPLFLARFQTRDITVKFRCFSFLLA
jgi:hypothetical protein